MKRFFSKRMNLLLSVTFVFALIFVLITVVIPAIIFNSNLNDLKDHLQYLTRNYETVTEVESTERLYVYEDGESELIMDAGTIYDIDTDIEVHLVLWGYDQSIPERFYEDQFQSRNFVYYIRVLEQDHFVIAFADTSELTDFVSNFRLYSIIIVAVLYIATMIFSSTYLSNSLIKKYSFYNPSSNLNSKVAFLHKYDKSNLSNRTIVYYNIYNIDDIAEKSKHLSTNSIHLLINQKLLKKFSFECIYQLSDQEFIVTSKGKGVTHKDFLQAINHRAENDELTPYEFKVKTVLIDQDVVSTLDGKTLINRVQYALSHFQNDNIDVTTVNKELLDLINEEMYYQSKLQDAIDNNNLINYYQVKVNPNSNKIIGAEALSRWFEGDTLVLPSKYIHLAEASGLIYDIDMISFKNACKTVKELENRNIINDDFILSTNFSPITLKNTSIDKIKNILEETEVNPNRISIEITESVALEFDKIKDVLDEFNDIGIHIEIDDFSAGNSSFTVLPLIKASTVKIDMAVLPDDMNKKNEVLIYDSLVSISKQLNKKIISEGVESLEQVEYLKTRDIDGIQGYYYSRPLPFDDLVKLITNQYKTAS